jgi:hypothetical protein
MTVQDLGALGEIIGAVAVIITLIYLAVQMRQSNRATHRLMYSSAAEKVSDFWADLASNIELFELYTRLLTDPDGLSRQESERAHLVLDAFLALMESYFLHNRQYGETLSQERWERILSRIFATPGGRLYWARRRFAFQRDFAEYVDGIVESAGSASS